MREYLIKEGLKTDKAGTNVVSSRETVARRLVEVWEGDESDDALTMIPICFNELTS